MNYSLEFKNVKAGYGSHKVLNGIDLAVGKGEFVGLIGPNGAGKSTFLKCIYGQVEPEDGEIYINDINIKKYTSRERAKQVAVVPQSFAIDYDFTVDDIVMMGRNPYVGDRTGIRRAVFRHKEAECDAVNACGGQSEFSEKQKANPHDDNRMENHKAMTGAEAAVSDRLAVDEALEMTNTAQFRSRLFNELSGGERQRVILARAIAQGSDILLLDEPISALDIQHQIEVMELIVKLNKEKGKTVVAVLHDLNLASRYCSRLVIINEGAVQCAGTPGEVITRENLKPLYNMNMIIRNNNIFDRPEIVPLRVIENCRTKRRRRIHIICGSGEAGHLLEELTCLGHELSVGVLNRGADDWSMACYLGLPMVETEPFSVISDKEQEQNLKLMKDAEILFVANVPFGTANIKNLDRIENFTGQIYIHSSCFENDYTPNGEAVRILNMLKNEKGAVVVADHDEFIELMGKEQ